MRVSCQARSKSAADSPSGLWLAHAHQRFPMLVTLTKDGKHAIKATDKLEREHWRTYYLRQQQLEEKRLANLSNRLRKQYSSLEQQKSQRKLAVLEKPPIVFRKRPQGKCAHAQTRPDLNSNAGQPKTLLQKARATTAQYTQRFNKPIASVYKISPAQSSTPPNPRPSTFQSASNIASTSKIPERKIQQPTQQQGSNIIRVRSVPARSTSEPSNLKPLDNAPVSTAKKRPLSPDKSNDVPVKRNQPAPPNNSIFLSKRIKR